MSTAVRLGLASDKVESGSMSSRQEASTELDDFWVLRRMAAKRWRKLLGRLGMRRG
jgi:hypothetical protein